MRARLLARRAAQEPENAHSHLLSMVLGNSETIPVTGGKLALGTWQVWCWMVCGVWCVWCTGAEAGRRCNGYYQVQGPVAAMFS